jgi:Tripartite tricarboxylate transporter TctB family
MVRRLVAARDFYAGLLLILVGLVAAEQGANYKLGSLTNMGPGFMPAALGGLLAILGILIAGSEALSKRPQEVAQMRPDWLGWLCIIGGPIVFILLAERVGMAPAAFGCVFVAALGDRTTTWREAALLAAGVTVFGVVLFNVFLGVPLSIVQLPSLQGLLR